jgi:exodeoxyribonuclease-3
VYVNFATKKGYSGVAILSKIKPINAIIKLNEEELDGEGRFILLEFDKCFLINVY